MNTQITQDSGMWDMTPTELDEMCAELIAEIETLRQYYVGISRCAEPGSTLDLERINTKSRIDYLSGRQEFCCALAAYRRRNFQMNAA
jgi:hypothetical protein